MPEAITKDIRVHVESEFAPGRSNPPQNQWFFYYTIRIINEGRETVQLLSRHWVITDAMGAMREVRGPGVVGKQPRLEPGQSFEYTSGAAIATAVGTMKGAYQMVAADGTRFEAQIPEFTLSVPRVLH